MCLTLLEYVSNNLGGIWLAACIRYAVASTAAERALRAMLSPEDRMIQQQPMSPYLTCILDKLPMVRGPEHVQGDYE